jgi:ribosomal protein L29
MTTAYDKDIVAWAIEQAALLRAGKLTEIDIENIAEEIESVGKSERDELVNRMGVLIAHLLKWRFQPSQRGASWRSTIDEQRRKIARRLKKTPSLRTLVLADADWLEEMWSDGVRFAELETGLPDMPRDWIWSVEQVLDETFWPD